MRVRGELRELNDDELMRRTADGERDAFQVLVRRHQTRAVSFGIRYLGNAAPAKDATQEAFVDLYLAAPKYRAEHRFPAFWHRILLNRCHMASRAGRSRSALYGQLDAVPALRVVPPEDELIARQRDVAVQRGLETLSDKLRVVVALRFSAGLSLQDIANTLELPLGTVKSRLFSGLAELRGTLQEDA